jgi:hypothetical protein
LAVISVAILDIGVYSTQKACGGIQRGLQYTKDLWWYSEMQCSLSTVSSQLFGHTFTLRENLQFPYCCTPCKQTFIRLVYSSLGACIKNLLFNFR